MLRLHLMQLLLIYISVPMTVESVTTFVQKSPALTRTVRSKSTTGCTGRQGYTGYRIVCRNIDDMQLRDMNVNVTDERGIRYNIYNSSLRNVTKGIFKNVSLYIFSLHDSEVEYFDLFGAFQGTEGSFGGIVLRNVHISNWKFSSGEDLIWLRIFDIKMPPKSGWIIDHIISYIPNRAVNIALHHFTVKYSENFTFVRFYRLYEISLQYNGITTLNRSYFALPAYRLEKFDFSHNPIKEIPEDIFIGMPKLDEITLRGTLITTLHFQTFLPILKSLKHLLIEEIPLTCDCDAAWLLKMGSYFGLRRWLSHWGREIICDQPNSLKNYTLADLAPIDMCYNCKEIQKNDSYYNIDQHTTPYNG